MHVSGPSTPSLGALAPEVAVRRPLQLDHPANQYGCEPPVTFGATLVTPSISQATPRSVQSPAPAASPLIEQTASGPTFKSNYDMLNEIHPAHLQIRFFDSFIAAHRRQDRGLYQTNFQKLDQIACFRAGQHDFFMQHITNELKKQQQVRDKATVRANAAALSAARKQKKRRKRRAARKVVKVDEKEDHVMTQHPEESGTIQEGEFTGDIPLQLLDQDSTLR